MEETARNEHVNYHHPLLRYKIWDLEFPALPSDPWNRWHYHKEVEMILLLEGMMLVETVERTYKLQGGDLLLIGSTRLHRTRRTEQVKQIVLQFDMLAQLDSYAKDFAPLLLELSEPLDCVNDALNDKPAAKEAMFRLLLGIYNEASEMGAGYELAVSGAFKQLLALIVRHAVSPAPMSPPDWQRLKPVLDYVEARYTEPIRIQDVLPLVHLEYHYFIKYFQQQIGMSFVDYLHLRRIKASERLLLTKPLGVADIGIQSGFPNATQFIRIFKRYNDCTPSEFRKKRLTAHEPDSPEQATLP
ncbi:HTH-type transcriptional activator RhaR [Paenibacillus solanacearum]|uniref:HTH-type transcriptional activator RhaR n=1 Tax=Paenibacillus solanacearum TaxID=2048548 RepID=A0A916K3J7_9BACL|nr:AraC family transcriptional regulator [Paenibacillus solanacearum]CAG7623630.1 HTH-type transcriptional activator RhaR [Paenibacillus solanacearum]